jgi:hypothetical protein
LLVIVKVAVDIPVFAMVSQSDGCPRLGEGA